jgi:hypothetical protein
MDHFPVRYVKLPKGIWNQLLSPQLAW